MRGRSFSPVQLTPVVQFRGFSKMTLSLQAQAPRVILSGFSRSNCIEKTNRKPTCQTCQFRVCLARIKSACEINNIQRRRVTCYMDENRLRAEFWRRTRGPRFAIDRNFGLCRRTHKIWCEYHGFLELILFSGKRQRSCPRNRVPTDGYRE